MATIQTALATTGASWGFVFDRLFSEIKIRHYSPKTLKAYRGWTRQLQGFTKSKDYNLLSQQDVVDFLSFLAVGEHAKPGEAVKPILSLIFEMTENTCFPLGGMKKRTADKSILRWLGNKNVQGKRKIRFS